VTIAVSGVLFLFALSIGGWIGYQAWQDSVIDVVGLRCAIADPSTGEKAQVALILRKARKDQSPTSLWTLEGDEAKPKETYKVCETTPDQLSFKGAGVSCGTEYKSSFEGTKRETFDFTINRKTLQLKIGDLPPSESCKETPPVEIRREWQKAYEDKVKGNRF